MRVKIAKWGNSLAVRIPRGVIEKARLKEGQEFDIEAKDGILQLKLAERRYDLAEMIEQMKLVSPEDRPRYEDWGIAGAEWPDEDWSDIAPTDEEMGIVGGAARRRS